MKLTGNIQDIKSTRDNSNSAIEIHINQIEYITQKKDGRYFQPFEFIDVLEQPVVITGDCLARAATKGLEENEYEFLVYDKVGDTYELNEDKHLYLTLEYIEEAQQTVLSWLNYEVNVSNETFKQIKSERQKSKKQKGKSRKSNR